MFYLLENEVLIWTTIKKNMVPRWRNAFPCLNFVVEKLWLIR